MTRSLNGRQTLILTALLLASSAAFATECSPPQQLQTKLHAHPSAENYAALGQYFGDKDQYPCAAQAWESAFKLEPNSAKFAYMLGSQSLLLRAAGTSHLRPAGVGPSEPQRAANPPPTRQRLKPIASQARGGRTVASRARYRPNVSSRPRWCREILPRLRQFPRRRPAPSSRDPR